MAPAEILKPIKYTDQLLSKEHSLNGSINDLHHSMDNKPKYPGVFRNKFRYFILILGTLCLTSVFSNMLTLNFTIICMDPLEALTHNITVSVSPFSKIIYTQRSIKSISTDQRIFFENYHSIIKY